MELTFKNTYTPKDKKIAILCLKQGEKKDGIFFYAHDLIEILSKDNNLTIVSNHLFFNTLSESIKNSTEFLKLPHISNRITKWLFLIIFLPFIISKKGQFDEIIFCTEDLPLLSTKFFRKVLFPKTKINLVVHDLAEYFISRYSPFKDLFRRIMVKRYIKFCDFVITVSQKTKSDLIELQFKNENNILLFYNQIKLPEVNLKESLFDFPYVLYVAGFDFPSKNHIGLINLFNSFGEKQFPYRLVLVGNADIKSKNLDNIKNKITELGLGNDIKILTNISKDQLDCLYQHCEFTVFPSLYEGFGRPIVESIHFGKKVYSSDVGVFKEVSSHPLVFPLDKLRGLK